MTRIDDDEPQDEETLAAAYIARAKAGDPDWAMYDETDSAYTLERVATLLRAGVEKRFEKTYARLCLAEINALIARNAKHHAKTVLENSR